MAFASAHQDKSKKSNGTKTSASIKSLQSAYYSNKVDNEDDHLAISHPDFFAIKLDRQHPPNEDGNNTKHYPPFAGFDFSRIRIIRPKLKISHPADTYEQEADKVAEQVMMIGRRKTSIHASPIAPKVVRVDKRIARKCKACEMKKEYGAEADGKILEVFRKPANNPLHTKAMGNYGDKEEIIANEINSVRSNSGGGGGFPLDVRTRNLMESRFGYDFGKVRIHTGELAAQSAQSINALAYTVGNEIIFGEGQYLPNSDSGRLLLAHELTHVIQQSSSVGGQIQRKIATEEEEERGGEDVEKEIEELLTTESFEAKWKKFVELTDSIKRSMFVETPAYMDIGSFGPLIDPLYETNKQQALELVDDLIAHLEQSSVDAYNYGMTFAKQLEFLGEKEKAAHVGELYQKGWEFMSYMKRPEDTDIAVDLGSNASAEGGGGRRQQQLPASEMQGVAAPPSSSSPIAVPKHQVATPANVAASHSVTKDKEQTKESEGERVVEDKANEPEKMQANEHLVKDIAAEPLPFANDLIVKLPYQTYLLAAPDKPYLVTGSIGKAMTDGRVVNGHTNFVIVLDLQALSQNIEKYYVAPLVSQGILGTSEAQYSSSDFSTFIQRESGQLPKIEVIFNRLDRTRNMQIIAVMLQDTDITPPEIATYFANRKIISAVKNEFAATPALAKDVFADADKLIGEGNKQEAADKLAALDESAFALLPPDKKIEYLELLTDAWTWEAQEKTIVEIFKSVSDMDELNKIKTHLKSKKVWDGSTMWEKMFSDLDHEYWSLLAAIGMKFSKTPYTLSEFKTLLWEYVRNVTVVGVFINSSGEPEIIPEAVKQIEAAVRGAVDFLEGIWDSIVMFVTHPDKIVEGVAQMLYLILNLQLAQLGYAPSIQYIEKVFTQISKQVVAAVRGLAIMGAEDVVIKKVKWALIWEVASWFIGVGEVKAALKSVQIGGLTEKFLSVARILSKAAGFGKLTIKEAELVSRFERLVTILAKESKILRSEEEAISLLSKLNNNELEKVVLALQKSEISEGTTLAQLVKETPELEGLAKKVESMQKLASADKKVAMTEKEISNLQKLVAEETDPMFQKLLEKEEQIFNEKVGKPGSVAEVADKDLKEIYDVEVKVGDHTYRRKIEDGTWCRYSSKKCNIVLDNSAVNKQRPKQQAVPSGTEPVGVEPRARGYAVEDAHLSNLHGKGWDGLPDYFPRIDGVKGGKVKSATRAGKQVKEIEGAEVLSIKSTRITDPETLETKIQEFVDALKPNSYSNGEVFVKNVNSKNLHLIFEQGFLDKVDRKEVFAVLKQMERTAGKQGVKFEWYVIPSNGRIINGPEFFKAQKAMIDAL